MNEISNRIVRRALNSVACNAKFKVGDKVVRTNPLNGSKCVGVVRKIIDEGKPSECFVVSTDNGGTVYAPVGELAANARACNAIQVEEYDEHYKKAIQLVKDAAFSLADALESFKKSGNKKANLNADRLRKMAAIFQEIYWK